MRFIVGLLIAVAVLFIAARVFVAFGVPVPQTLGISNDQLQPCPDTPNCVSTQAPAADTEHFMPAIPFTGNASDAVSKIVSAINAMPRSKLISQDANYLHAEFRSFVFRFVDDTEFYIDDANKLIHFRSTARLGKGDMGVNRKRMIEFSEKIKALL
jgi:uncharacterized protein (DUF1499 family)